MLAGCFVFSGMVKLCFKAKMYCDKLPLTSVTKFHSLRKRERRRDRILETRPQKKPTWRNTLRYSTTSVYSLTGSPAQPGCPSSSHPTTSFEPNILVELDRLLNFTACRKESNGKDEFSSSTTAVFEPSRMDPPLRSTETAQPKRHSDLRPIQAAFCSTCVVRCIAYSASAWPCSWVKPWNLIECGCGGRSRISGNAAKLF